MRPRTPLTNIPIDLIRTFVAISHFRGYGKAGDALNLSQPAVSAQMKRLQKILGGELFDRGPGGTEMTPFGSIVLPQARRLLDINDQLLSLGRGMGTRSMIRLGIGYVFATDYFAACRQMGSVPNLSLQIGHSDDIKKLYDDEHLDVICILAPTSLDEAICVWDEDPVWVRSPDFVLSPGHPLPIIGKLDASTASTIHDALRAKQVTFRVVLTSSDLQTRLQAAAEGLGITVHFRRFIQKPLMEAKEYYLPPIEPITAAICARDPEQPGLKEVLKRLMTNKPNLNMRRHN